MTKAVSKAPKKLEAVIQADVKFKALHNLEPWSCLHHGNRSVIEAYVMAKGDWQTVATVEQTASIDAEKTADFIARAVNDFERHRQTIAELIVALELCLTCDGLTWEAEIEAEGAIRRAKNA